MMFSKRANVNQRLSFFYQSKSVLAGQRDHLVVIVTAGVGCTFLPIYKVFGLRFIDLSPNKLGDLSYETHEILYRH